MKVQAKRSFDRRVTALLVAAVLAFGALIGAPPANAADEFTVNNAEFRWGLNKQSAGPSHGPGHNFFSAGNVLDVPGTITASTWLQKSGNVSIEKRVSANSTVTPEFADTATDQSGTAFANSSSKYSGLEMVFGKGTGTVDPDAGTLEIEWEGTVTVLYYSGLTRMSISDPVMTVNGTAATVTATMGGYETDRDDPSISNPMTPREVVIANIDREKVDLTDDKGYSVTPDYFGVTYSAKSGDAGQLRSGDYWGSFPAQFVDFASDAGAASFWYSSGSSDSTKPALPITVSYDASDPADVSDSGTSSGSKGILGQVIDDTVEDILRAAGTDVADTAAAWMDEAWKPLQPDAVNASQAAGGDVSDAQADVNSDAVVDSEFAYEYETHYSVDTPMTAGTVGAVAASSPATSSGNRPASAPAAAAPVSDQSTMPVAANLPLTDVVYAQSAASKTHGSSSQWQWWVGAALLVATAVMFFLAVRRKA